MRTSVPTRVVMATAAAAMTVSTMSACTLFGSGDDDKIQFMSLAWQPDSVQANKDIVAEWNEANPDNQVEYVQGNWDDAHDELLTSFEGDEAPDVIHYEANATAEFAGQGYLADLTDMPSKELQEGIPEDTWDTVTTPDDQVTGVPFLQESQVVLANKKMMDDAGVDVPAADDPWTWDEFAANAKKMSQGDSYGVAWPLKEPVNRVMNLSMNFGGGFFDVNGDSANVKFDEAEQEVPQRIHDMIYEDESADPSQLNQGATDPLPAFYDGQFGMIPGSIFLRQSLAEEAPEDFEWVTLPPLAGENQEQANNPQTLSIAEQSDKKDESMEFINEFLSPENMSQLAMGDWMIPTSEQAKQEVLDTTEGGDGWDVAVESADGLVRAPFQDVAQFPEWESKHATPAFQEYFAGTITLEELEEQLESGQKVLD